MCMGERVQVLGTNDKTLGVLLTGHQLRAR